MRRCLPAAAHTLARLSSRNVSFKVVNKDGEEWSVTDVREGQRLHEILKKAEVPIECSCGGQVACTTCHVVLPQRVFDHMPKAEDDEEDMLDIAEALQDTSRLACSLRVDSSLDGETLVLPDSVKDYWN